MLDPENKSDRPNDVDVADESGLPDTESGKSGLRRFSGIWKGHPDLKEFRDNVDAYRRSVDESSE